MNVDKIKCYNSRGVEVFNFDVVNASIEISKNDPFSYDGHYIIKDIGLTIEAGVIKYQIIEDPLEKLTDEQIEVLEQLSAKYTNDTVAGYLDKIRQTTVLDSDHEDSLQ